MLALVILVLLSLGLGAVSIPLGQQWAVLTGGEAPETARQILLLVRWPRVLAALLAGSALAVAGYILQTVLGNPLAGPNILGINAGSGLFVLALAALLPQWIALAPLAAFLGALLSAMA
nr:iron chelate uptake ABC transporter family permease subunit [bacterium]